MFKRFFRFLKRRNDDDLVIFDSLNSDDGESGNAVHEIPLEEDNAATKQLDSSSDEEAAGETPHGYTALPASSLSSEFHTLDEDTQKAFLIEKLTDIIGEALPDTANVTVAQLQHILRSVNAQRNRFRFSPAVADAGIARGIDELDVGYHTFLRLVIVFLGVLNNHANDEHEYTPNNPFTEALRSTPGLAYGLSAASIIPLALGFAIEVYQLSAAKNANRISQLIKLVKDQTGQTYTTEEVIAIFQEFCDRGLIPADPGLSVHPLARNEKNRFAERFIRLRESKAVTTIAKGWSFLANAAVVFWPVWMISVLVVGSVALSYALPVLPVVVGISIGITIAIKAGIRYAKKRSEKKKKQQNLDEHKSDYVVAQEDKSVEQEQENLDRIGREERVHFVMFAEHKKFKAAFDLDINASNTNIRPGNGYTVFAVNDMPVHVKQFNEANVPADGEVEDETRTVKQRIAAFSQEIIRVETKKRNIRNTLDKLSNSSSKIGQYLLGTEAQRNRQIAVSMANDAITYYTLSNFVVWLAGAACISLSFIPLPIIGAGAGFCAALLLGDILPGISAAFNTLIGVLYSFNAFAKTKNAQLAYEELVVTRLAQEYKETGKTNQEVFDEKYAAVEALNNATLRSQLAAKKIALQEKIQQGGTLTKAEQYLFDVKLDDYDTLNHYFYQTAKRHRSLATIAKDIGHHIFKSINALQTLMFISRSLFLVGTALAGVCLLFGPAAGFVFIAIAVTMAVIGVALKLKQMQNERERAAKMQMVESFSTRINDLEKMHERLSKVEATLNPGRSAADIHAGLGVSPQRNSGSYDDNIGNVVSTMPSSRRGSSSMFFDAPSSQKTDTTTVGTTFTHGKTASA